LIFFIIKYFRLESNLRIKAFRIYDFKYGATNIHGFVFEHEIQTCRMGREQLDILFKDYEEAFNKLDLKTIPGFYSDVFISAGPKCPISQSKKEFQKKAEEDVYFYRSVGQRSAKIVSKRIMPICNEYSMVVIRWGVTFEKTGDKLNEFDISYIVHEKPSGPEIILFISHQDEEEALKKLGLKQETSKKAV
jgi:hypothetical protein